MLIKYNDFKLPEEWLKFYNSYNYLNKKYNYWIAGGCLRDLELGADVKDIDIWTNKEKLLEDPTEIKFPSNDYDEFEVTKEKDSHGNEYDIIHKPKLTSLEDVLEGFDLGICQIGFDGENVYCTENYIRDKSCKTITILKEVKYGTGTWKHLERVAKKYKEYRII